MPTLDGRIDNLVAGDDLQITRTITGVPSGATLSDAWFTVKSADADADAEKIIQKAITPTDVPGTGEITDTGADGTGAVRFDLTDVDTALLEPGREYVYDVQVKTDGGAIYTPEKGRIKSVQGVTTTTT